MAKDEDDKKKALTKNGNGNGEMTVKGSYMPSELEEFILKDGGFAKVETVLIGDPADGKIPYYLGKLIGPGADIDIQNDGKVNKLPTWSFHPMVKTEDGKVGSAENITQVVPSPHILNAHLVRIYAEAEKHEKAAIVAVFAKAKIKSRKGNPLNDFDVFEKYVPHGDR